MEPKDQIKETLSITEVVSTYIRLEKSGSQFRARCPFHTEKTPSFYVSPERKSFHCFGCQEHGDIFSFVEKIENIPFYEALKILADRAGVQLKNGDKNKVDTRLISLLDDATTHFIKNIQNSPEAMSYLLDRGLTKETIETFKIGYAKNEWRDLFIYLVSLDYTPEEIENAGVAIKATNDNGSTKGWYDRFRGRVMFPIRNVSGATVGYSGRIMPSLVDPSIAQGKYVNTPETALYHKSKILFGYDTAKKKMNETKEVIVVEGQMDLCMSYQAGVHNTVAVSGTAFTDEHISLIKRFCDKVILSFDSDTAGQNALKKTALLCLLGGLDVYVVGDIGKKDPADLIKEDKDKWLEAINKKKHVVEVMTKRIIEDVKDNRARGQKIVSDVLPFIRAINSPIDRAHFIQYISNVVQISEQALVEELSKGFVPAKQETVENDKPTISRKERVERDILAYVRLYNLYDDKRFIDLCIDAEKFPDAIIESEVFSLEKRISKSDTERKSYFEDLISAYKNILKQEKILVLQEKIRNNVGDQESSLKELHHLMKSI